MNTDVHQDRGSVSNSLTRITVRQELISLWGRGGGETNCSESNAKEQTEDGKLTKLNIFGEFVISNDNITLLQRYCSSETLYTSRKPVRYPTFITNNNFFHFINWRSIKTICSDYINRTK